VFVEKSHDEESGVLSVERRAAMRVRSEMGAPDVAEPDAVLNRESGNFPPLRHSVLRPQSRAIALPSASPPNANIEKRAASRPGNLFSCWMGSSRSEKVWRSNGLEKMRLGVRADFQKHRLMQVRSSLFLLLVAVTRLVPAQNTPDTWRAEHRTIDLHMHIDPTEEHFARAVKIMDAAGIGIGVNLSGGTVTHAPGRNPSSRRRRKWRTVSILDASCIT
jgi:hypothetical protein